MKKDVLYLAISYPQVRINKFIKYLIQENYNVKLLLCNYNNSKKGIWDEYTTPLSIEENNKFFTKYPFSNKLLKKLNSEIEKINLSPDIIIVRDIFLANYAQKIAKKYNSKLLIDIADNYPEVILQNNPYGLGKIFYQISNFFEKKVLDKANTILCVTRESKKLLSDKHGISEGKIIPIRNLPLKNEVGEIFNKERLFDFVYIGTFSKNIRDLVTIIKTLQLNPELSFHVYTFQKVEVEEFIRNFIDIDNYKIEIRNPVKKSELNFVLSNYKVGLIPHFRGPGTDYTEPNKLYDYIHANLPVLASDNPSLKNSLTNLSVGECYKPNDPQSLLDGYNLIVENYEKYLEAITAHKCDLIWEKEISILNDYLKG
ncbi:glycosyltransferase [Lederbergia citrea]|uniref:glycosyltransferase n=1 Tax=Lederbergia citrea TaxID=2833581 RepID=UPI001BC9A754|nr:glycosyltransferase [Lederbergia citrea]MBS4204799.1 glycosyltransferase [Lederbergia citrea]